jgi:hypothetical protein
VTTQEYLTPLTGLEVVETTATALIDCPINNALNPMTIQLFFMKMNLLSKSANPESITIKPA